MKSVLEDIKNQEYKQAYLFFGEEGYLKKQYRNKLLQAWNPDGDTMNESRFEGKGIDVKEVISLGETMPFFSDRRIRPENGAENLHPTAATSYSAKTEFSYRAGHNRHSLFLNKGICFAYHSGINRKIFQYIWNNLNTKE